MPNVYITNKSAHDFSDAERFGTLVYLTAGTIKRYNTNSLYREMIDGLVDAQAGDYLLVSSLNILNVIAAGILARRFGVLNLLLWRSGKYIERTINVDALLP